MPEKSPIDHIIDLKGQVGALEKSVLISEEDRVQSRLAQQEIKDCLNELTKRMDAMPDAEHKEHHDFINTLIKESEQRQRVRAAVLEKLTSGGIWAGISAIGALIWLGIKHKFGIGSN